MENLWGDLNLGKIDTPKSILEQQGDFLTKETRRKVYGEVKVIDELEFKSNQYLNYKKQFNYKFDLRSDYLPDYSYKLLSIHHDIEIYPLQIKLTKSVLLEIENKIINSSSCYLGKQYKSINTGKIIEDDAIIVEKEDGFKEVLKLILQSTKVRNILISLISLAN